MADRRIQVDSTGLTPSTLLPVASPVSTFTGPGDAGQRLAQLSRALSGIAPSLRQFAGQVAQREDAEARQQGMEETFKEAELHGRTLAEAQRSGEIPPTANPMFMAGFKEQFGRVGADKWAADAVAAVRSSKALQSAVDPEKALPALNDMLRQNLNDFLKGYAGGDAEDSSFTYGFYRRAEQHLNAIRQEYVNNLNMRVGKASNTAQFEEIVGEIERSIGKVDPQVIADGITAYNNDLYKQGRDGTIINSVTADAISEAAQKHPEMGSKILALMDLVHTGPDGKGVLGQTQYAIEKLVKTRDDVSDGLWKQQTRERSVLTQMREEQGRQIGNEALKALIAQGNGADMRPYLQSLAAIGNPDAAGQIASLQHTVGEISDHTDNGTYQNLYLGIWGDGQTAPTTTWLDIAQSFKGGKLSSADADKLRQMLEDRASTSQRSISDWMGNPLFKAAYSSLAEQFRDPILGILGGNRGDKLKSARLAFVADWLNYMRTEGQSASSDDKAKWIDRESKQVVQALRSDEMAMSGTAPTPFSPTGDLASRLPKDLVLTEGDLASIMTGAVSPGIVNNLSKYGLKDASEIGAFYRDQANKFREKYNRQPEAQRKPKHGKE